MSREEVAAFEQNPFHPEAVRVRIWDDRGKIAGKMTKRFRHYAELLQRVIGSN